MPVLRRFLSKAKHNEWKHMSLIMTKDNSSEIHVGEIIIKCSESEKLLGVKIN